MGFDPLSTAIGGGIGLALSPIKHNQDMAAYNRNKEMQAKLAQWSPWSGIKAEAPGSAPSLFNTALQGAMSGASFGGGLGGMMGGSPTAAAANPMAGATEMPTSAGGYEASPFEKYLAQDEFGEKVNPMKSKYNFAVG